MNLNCDETTRREFFIKKLNECKKESESLFESDTNILKTLYVNKILTTFHVNFEIIYNSLEYFHLAVYQESFHTEDDIYTKYYEMNFDTIRGYIEKKLKEHLVCHNYSCDVLSCESPYNINCPQYLDSFFVCSVFCYLSIFISNINLRIYYQCFHNVDMTFYTSMV